MIFAVSCDKWMIACHVFCQWKRWKYNQLKRLGLFIIFHIYHLYNNTRLIKDLPHGQLLLLVPPINFCWRLHQISMLVWLTFAIENRTFILPGQNKFSFNKVIVLSWVIIYIYTHNCRHLFLSWWILFPYFTLFTCNCELFHVNILSLIQNNSIWP